MGNRATTKELKQIDDITKIDRRTRPIHADDRKSATGNRLWHIARFCRNKESESKGCYYNGGNHLAKYCSQNNIHPSHDVETKEERSLVIPKHHKRKTKIGLNQETTKIARVEGNPR